MNEAYHIRTAGWRDLKPVSALEKVCFQKDAWPWIDILAALTFAATLRFVAEVEERIVGFVVGDLRRSEDLGWIATIGVDPAFRRRGIGARLLATCEREMGVSRVRLTLRPSNTAARRLYEKAGYVEIDRWKRYYRGGEDGVVMEKVMPTARGAAGS